MPALFREKPAVDLVERFLHTFGLTSLGDATWFSKQQIKLSSFQELLPELEPYYLPCKAAEYIYGTLNPGRAITILRHLLRAHGAQLLSMEKSRGGEKAMWYQIQSSEIKSSMEVSFD
jgi:hypothetical protein